MNFYTSVGRDSEGDGYIAVISLGHPNVGNGRTIICEAKRCKTVKEGKKWGAAQVANPEWRKEMENQDPKVRYEVAND